MSKKTIRCPYCGSEKTAWILRGMPALSEKLERDLEAGTVILGGCMVSDSDPSYECRECGKQFGRPPVLKVTGEDGRIRKILPEMITGIEYSIGGYFGGSIFINMVKEGRSSAVCVAHSYDEKLFYIREFSTAEWKRLLDKLFKRLFVHGWEQNYRNS